MLQSPDRACPPMELEITRNIQRRAARRISRTSGNRWGFRHTSPDHCPTEGSRAFNEPSAFSFDQSFDRPRYPRN